MDTQSRKVNCCSRNLHTLNFIHIVIPKTHTGCLITFGTKCLTSSVNIHAIEKEDPTSLRNLGLSHWSLRLNIIVLKNPSGEFSKKHFKNNLLAKSNNNKKSKENHHQNLHKKIIEVVPLIKEKAMFSLNNSNSNKRLN